MPNNDVLFIIGDWKENVGSRDTWSNRQVFPWSTKWSRAKANTVLPREPNGHSKHSLPITQETTLHMTSPHGQYKNWIDFILCSQRWRSSIQSEKTRPGTDCVSGHELLIAKFRLKLKKVGKTTRSFSSVQFSSVAQSCLTLCDPMNRSTPGLPVHHHLLEFIQSHVHPVGDAIQPSHPLSSPSPPAPNPSQHQSLFQWVNSLHEVAKVLEFQL